VSESAPPEVLRCQDCGFLIERAHPRGRKPRLCAHCRRLHRSRAQRRYRSDIRARSLAARSQSGVDRRPLDDAPDGASKSAAIGPAESGGRTETHDEPAVRRIFETIGRARLARRRPTTNPAWMDLFDDLESATLALLSSPGKGTHPAEGPNLLALGARGPADQADSGGNAH
jgi:hypothetical protein